MAGTGGSDVSKETTASGRRPRGDAAALGTAKAAEALSALRDIDNEAARALRLAQLAPHIPPDLLGPALTVARSIEDESSRATALAQLAPHLPSDLLREALMAVDNIRNESIRADLLADLAPHLPVDLMADALTLAASVEDQQARTRAAWQLAAHLPPNVLSDALTSTMADPRAILLRDVLLTSQAGAEIKGAMRLAIGGAWTAEDLGQLLTNLNEGYQAAAAFTYLTRLPASMLPSLRGRPIEEVIALAAHQTAPLSIASIRYESPGWIQVLAAWNPLKVMADCIGQWRTENSQRTRLNLQYQRQERAYHLELLKMMPPDMAAEYAGRLLDRVVGSAMAVARDTRIERVDLVPIVPPAPYSDNPALPLLLPVADQRGDEALRDTVGGHVVDPTWRAVEISEQQQAQVVRDAGEQPVAAASGAVSDAQHDVDNRTRARRSRTRSASQ